MYVTDDLEVLYDWGGYRDPVPTISGDVDYESWLERIKENMERAGRVVVLQRISPLNRIRLLANPFKCDEECGCEDCLRYFERNL